LKVSVALPKVYFSIRSNGVIGRAPN